MPKQLTEVIYDLNSIFAKEGDIPVKIVGIDLELVDPVIKTTEFQGKRFVEITEPA